MRVHQLAKRKSAWLIQVLVLLAMGSFFTAPALASKDAIVFGAQAWPGATIKTEVARQILERIGYKTKVTSGTSAILSMGLRQGDIDVMLENWMPDMKRIIQQNLESGKAKQLAVNIEDARLDLVVPAYVWEAGIHSIDDLHKHGDRFKHRVLGIESGNVDNEIVKKAIADNTYDLGHWQLVPSSTAAMMTQVGKYVQKKKWVVFIGWRPHWMNIEYDLKYLNDPKGMFGESSRVLTIANTGFVNDNPNVEKFFKQYVQSTKTESDWIYAFGYKKQGKKDVARDWIEKHMDMVAEWLEGVKTADGKEPAIQAMQ